MIRRKGQPAACNRERGAAAVETAIILPVVLMVALGMFYGGLAYNQKISLTQAAREAARYGATLYPELGMSGWLTSVRERAMDSAFGDLDAGVSGRYICVAYLGTDPTIPDGGLIAISLVDDVTGVTIGGTPCFLDGRGDESRVQVRLARDAEFNALTFQTTIPLSSDAVGRYELVRK